MVLKELSIHSIGKIARAALGRATLGTVFGVTSRGVFVQIGSGWMIFISFEPFHGPLTLNLGGAVQALRDLVPGSAVEVMEGDLSIPRAGVVIRTKPAQAWEARRPSTALLPPADREARLISVARGVSAVRGTAGFGLSLVNITERRFLPDLIPIREALEARSPDRLVQSLEPFLGLGSGLTPSGDDLTTGLLLALNRWGKLAGAGLEVKTLNRGIIHAAYPRTTTLGANLIECATQGQADERLLMALDGILTGPLDIPGCVSNLLSWGSTSGGDALVGMALAVLTMSEP